MGASTWPVNDAERQWSTCVSRSQLQLSRSQQYHRKRARVPHCGPSPFVSRSSAVPTKASPYLAHSLHHRRGLRVVEPGDGFASGHAANQTLGGGPGCAEPRARHELCGQVRHQVLLQAAHKCPHVGSQVTPTIHIQRCQLPRRHRPALCSLCSQHRVEQGQRNWPHAQHVRRPADDVTQGVFRTTVMAPGAPVPGTAATTWGLGKLSGLCMSPPPKSSPHVQCTGAKEHEAQQWRCTCKDKDRKKRQPL